MILLIIVMPELATATFGNACHAIASASILAYTIATFLFAEPGSTFFDAEWVRHGFCIIQEDVPYWSSHDLCLYADVVLVAIGLLVYRSLRGVPAPAMKYGDEMMLLNLLGHLGHGAAHGALGAQLRGGDGEGAQQLTDFERLSAMAEERDHMQILRRVAMGVLFWIGLLKGVLPRVSLRWVTPAAALVHLFGVLCVRDVLAFAYVQAVLTVAFSSTQLTLPRQDKHYAYAAFAAAGVPLSVIPWIESTMCQGVAARFGGHLMYDVAIPTLLTCAYYSSWRHYSKQDKEKLV